MAENELKSSDRFPKGIWWRWNLHHEAFPSTCHRDTAVTDPLLETLFSSSISLWFLHLWTAGKSSLYSQLPKAATSRDVLGKQQGESGKCSHQCHRCPCHSLKKSHSSGNVSAPDIYTVTLTPHSAIHCCIFLWAGMQVHTMLVTPADAGTPEWLCLGHWSSKQILKAKLKSNICL